MNLNKNKKRKIKSCPKITKILLHVPLSAPKRSSLNFSKKIKYGTFFLKIPEILKINVSKTLPKFY